MKKRMSVFLVLLLVLSLAAVMHGNAEESVSTVGEGDQNLVLYTEFVGQQLEFLKEQAAAFCAQNPGVSIEVVSTQSQSFDTFFKTAVAGNEQIDIVQVNIQFYRDYVSKGYLQPIEAYVDLSLTPKLDMAWEQEAYFSMKDEKYGVPTGLDSSAFYYNPAIFAEYGLEPPTTWADVYAIRDALEGSGIAAMVYAGAEPWWNPMHFNILFYQMTKNHGLEVNDKFMAGDFSEEVLQPYYDTLNFFAGLDADGVFISGTQGMDLPTATTLFTEGKAAMYYHGTWFRQDLAASAPDFEYMICPVPIMEEGLESQPAGSISMMYCIYANAEYPEIAGKFIEFYTGPEVQQQGFDSGTFTCLSITPDVYPPSNPVNDEYGKIAPSTTIWLDAIWEPEIITDFQQGCQAVILKEKTAEQVMEEIMAHYERLREQGKTFF